MAYNSAATTDNVAEYWGLAHGLRQENISGYSPLSVNRESALLLLHLRTLQPQRTTHLVRLFQEARAVAKDLDLSIWGHHYHIYNKMADPLANIAMDTGLRYKKTLHQAESSQGGFVP